MSLVQQLTDAAAAVIETRAPDLERDPKRVRGLTIELVIGPRGQVDATCWTEHRLKLGARAER